MGKAYCSWGFVLAQVTNQLNFFLSNFYFIIIFYMEQITINNILHSFQHNCNITNFQSQEVNRLSSGHLPTWSKHWLQSYIQPYPLHLQALLIHPASMSPYHDNLLHQNHFHLFFFFQNSAHLPRPTSSTVSSSAHHP